MIDKKYLNEYEATDFVDLKVATLRQRRHAHKPPLFIKVGHKVFYEKEELQRFQQSCLDAADARRNKVRERVERISKTHYKEFGNFLRDHRRKAKMTLRTLARAISISSTYLSKIEQGECGPPAEEKIKDLAHHIKVAPDLLMSIGGKIPSDLKIIFSNKPIQIAEFLRKTQGLSDQEWIRVLSYVERFRK
jgi:transcriptional regulator with XRE-family HTH domain